MSEPMRCKCDDILWFERVDANGCWHLRCDKCGAVQIQCDNMGTELAWSDDDVEAPQDGEWKSFED